MFVKLALVSCMVAVSLALYNGPLAGGVPASLYPAGISPQACPNYPHCTNPSVAATPNAPAPYAPVAAPYQPGPNAYSPYNPNQNALDSGTYTGDGDYRGEGLAESGAYGDVSQAYNSAPAYNPAPAYPQYGQPGPAAQVPAGVDPHSCPNYPFCH